MEHRVRTQNVTKWKYRPVPQRIPEQAPPKTKHRRPQTKTVYDRKDRMAPDGVRQWTPVPLPVIIDFIEWYGLRPTYADSITIKKKELT